MSSGKGNYEKSGCRFSSVKGVRTQIEDNEPINTSKEIIEALKNFEKNVIISAMDKKKQSFISEDFKKSNNKVSSDLYLKIEKKQENLLKLAPEFVKVEAAETKTVNIKIGANLKEIIDKLRIKGYFHRTKNRPTSNLSLVNFSDVEIIKNYNIIMHGLLNWFSGADNFHSVKGVIEALRKSCALTLKLKHKYKSLHQIYTTYGLNIRTNEVKLCPRIKVLNRKKRFNLSKNQNKLDYNDLWYFVKTVK